MKATKKQYAVACKIYERSRHGQSAVLAYAEREGITSHSFCEPCESDTPDCEDGACLVCGSQKAEGGAK